MTVHLNNIETLADSYFQQDAYAYSKAIEAAQERVRCSYFDQHIVRSMHGHYWVADEGDYEAEWPDFAKDIVHTIPLTRAGRPLASLFCSHRAGDESTSVAQPPLRSNTTNAEITFRAGILDTPPQYGK